MQDIKNNMTKRIIAAVGLLLLAAGCSNSTDDTLGRQLDRRMKNLAETSELGTVEYTVTKIIKANDNSAAYKLGDRKIIFSCKATIKAGIDLADFSRQDISVDEETKSVAVSLPKPRILSFSMPPEDTHIVYEKVGVLRSNFSTADRMQLLTQGEAAIMADVDNLGIMKDAENYARLFFQSVLTQTGFENITVNFR